MRIHICVLMSTQLHMHIMIYKNIYMWTRSHCICTYSVTHISHMYTLIQSLMQAPMHTHIHTTHKVLSYVHVTVAADKTQPGKKRKRSCRN